MFVIYTKAGCPNCEKTKQLLADEPKLIIECDALLKANREEFITEMKRKTQWEHIRFPMIFIDDVFLGGYSNLINYMAFEMDDEDLFNF